MLSADDLADVLWDQIKKKVPEKSEPSLSAPKQKGRRFLSEYEIKRMIGAGKILRVSESDILSPLALDWLLLKGINILRGA